MTPRLASIAAALLAALALAAPAHAATAPATAAPVAAPQPARIAVEALAAPRAASYVVAPGDTLGAIAARFCGGFAAFPGLASASGIVNADLIFPGQTIRLSGCSGATNLAAAGSTVAAAPAPVTSSTASDRAVAFAIAQVGKPYVFGAAGPNAYDCSGLVMAAYAQVGIHLPHYTGTMIGYGRPVSRADLRPGDVIWPYGDLSHVVLYIGGGRIVEAPQPGQSVHTTNLYSFAAARRMV